MRILITGLGLVGKSTFRRRVKNLISVMGISVEDTDGDYQKIPGNFKERVVYVIEDVHGLTEEACLPLNNYDLIIYLLPTPFSHLVFWLKRMLVWFREGKGSWDKKRQGWLGSGKKYDPLNISLFLGLLIHDFKNRRKWINEDSKVLSGFKNAFLIRPQWTKNGIEFHLTRHF